MPDRNDKTKEQRAQGLGSFDVTELDDESLEDVAGGAVPNGNCGNTSCCGQPDVDSV